MSRRSAAAAAAALTTTTTPTITTTELKTVQPETTTLIITKLEANIEQDLAAQEAAEREAELAIRQTNNAGADDDDDEDDDEEDDEDDDEEMEEDFTLELNRTEGLEGVPEEADGSSDNASNKSKSAVKKGENEKLRRRLPMSVKELIDYHSSNGKSIKEIVNKINVVCRSDEKVSYGVSLKPFKLNHLINKSNFNYKVCTKVFV